MLSLDAILNWLWQGSLVALAAAAFLRGLGSVRAWARCLVAWAAMIAVLLLPLIPQPSADPSLAPLVPAAAGRVPVVTMPTGWWSAGAPIAGLWALWVVLHAARAARALVTLQRARRRCRPLPTEVERQLIAWLQVRAGGRPTRIVLSDDVRAAAVLGCGSPLVAIAPALLAHLRIDDLDRLVIHEWAHVRRRDDLADVLLLGIRIAAGWHPAVWWLDGRLRAERETACDETVIAITGGRRAYAQCLATLASLRWVSRPAFAGVGVLSSSGLGLRVARILAPRRHSSPRSAWTACTASVLVGAFGLMLSGVRLVEPALAFEDDVPPMRAVPAVERRTSSVPSPERANGRAFVQPGNDASGQPRPAAPRLRASPGGQVPSGPAESPAEDSKPGLVAEHTAPLPMMAARPSGSLVWNLRPPSDLPTEATGTGPAAPPASASSAAPEADATTPSPWRATAAGGMAIGRGSRKAATATAGFFTRFGSQIAGSF